MQVKKSAQTERGGNRRNIPSKRLLDFNRLSAGRDLRFLINYIAISSFSTMSQLQVRWQGSFPSHMFSFYNISFQTSTGYSTAVFVEQLKDALGDITFML